MKETIKINLEGVVFNIDQDAYEELKKYLDSISASFKDSSEREEILQDIEIRISEIFQETLGKSREVVTIEDVQKVVKIMGNPEEYGEQSEGEQVQEPRSRRSNRRMYRDPDNAVIAGVSSGIGAYLDVDPIVFRVLFIVLCIPYGMGALLYAILWIALPKANSTAQKMEMRGERLTIDNIEKNVRKEFEQVKDNLNKYSKSNGYKRHKNVANEVFGAFGKVITFFAKFIAGIVAFALILAGFAGIIGLITALFVEVGVLSADFWGFDNFSFEFFDYMLGSRASVVLFSIALFLLIGIPLFAIIYTGFSILFNFRSRSRGFGLFLLFVWIISVFVLAFTGVFEARQFTSHGKFIEKTDFEEINNKTLYLHLNANDEENDYISDHVVFEIDDQGLYWDSDAEKVWGKPDIDIVRSKQDVPRLTVTRFSQGPTHYKAKRLAEEIIYDIKQEGNHLYFDTYFELEDGEKWRAQNIEIDIWIPEGMLIYIGEDMDMILDHVDTRDYDWDRYLGGKYWKMTKRGLVEVKED